MNNEKYFQKKREDFPILNEKIRNQKLVYFDSAATSHKPQCVIDSLLNYYTKTNSNVHRGDHYLSQKSTNDYENARENIAKLLNTSSKNIVFNSGATIGMNQVAYGIKHLLKEGDEIVISEMEHHSNILIWLEIAKELNLVVKTIPITKNFELDYKKAKEIITNKTKLVAISHMSNVLGTINDIKKLTKISHKVGAQILIDGCQGIVHTQVDVKSIGCDFYIFSAHKLYGPTGVGVLYVKDFSKIKSMYYGGGQIQSVNLIEENKENQIKGEIKYLQGAQSLEAGTPNIADIIAFNESIKYLENIDKEKLHQWDRELGDYFLDKIKELGSDFILYGKKEMKNRGLVFAFKYLNKHPSDIATLLDQFGIATRSGYHCAEPLHRKLNTQGTIRMSMCFYNTKKEIDYFIESMKKIKDIL